MNYDYIIIGAGSAGCVLANRLSADPANQVLLLEAGVKDSSPLIKIPSAYPKLNRTKIDWAFETEPQEHVLNRKIFLPRGKTLGGCSSTNAMAYVRGNAADYDDWAEMGNKGWSHEEVLPYFKKSEHNEQIENDFHGQNGELNVTFAKKFQTPLAQAFVDACVNQGFERNHDYNGAIQAGAGFIQFTIKNQERHSAAAAFLKPALQRPNLHVRTEAQVKRILINDQKAFGVEVHTGKTSIETIKAAKEIILSAGSFHSPLLLMLSGMGDARELAKMEIDVKHDLKGVGQNLQDHLFSGISCTVKGELGQNHNLKAFNQLKSLGKYLLSKSGPLTISPLEAVAFGNVMDPTGRVDFQFHFSPIQIGNDYKADMYDVNTYPHNDGFTILPTLIRPESRGFVALREADIRANPYIQPNFLSIEKDKELLLKSAKIALRVAQDNAFDQFGSELITPPNANSDEGIMDHLLRQLETVYHPVGTCKMGSDELAVVNDQLQVHGIEGLRVVDASVMPKIVSGNTNAPVYMIAEKAADMILGG